MLRCERCGKEVGAETVLCPERSRGECLFSLQVKPRSTRLGCVLLVGAGVLLTGALYALGTLLFGGEEIDRSLHWFTFAFLGLAGTPFVLWGLLEIYGRIETQNSLAGPGSCERSVLWGIETSKKVVTDVEPVPVELAPRRAFRYPPSLAALHLSPPEQTAPNRMFRGDDYPLFYLAECFKAALLGLLASGRIKVLCTTTLRSSFGGRLKPVAGHSAYVLAPGDDAGEADGLLEKLILKIVANWTEVLAGPRPPMGPGVLRLPHGPNFFEVLVGVVWGEELFDRNAMLFRVHQDAEWRGLGFAKRHLTKSSRFHVAEEMATVLEEEQRLVEDLGRQLSEANADLFEAIDGGTYSAAQTFRIDKYDSVTS